MYPICYSKYILPFRDSHGTNFRVNYVVMQYLERFYPYEVSFLLHEIVTPQLTEILKKII